MQNQITVQSQAPEQAMQPRPADAVEHVRIAPPADIYENDDELVLLADMPGVSPEALEIQLDPPELRVRGRSASGEVPVEYLRAFRVDHRIDPDAVEAKLEAGVLSVHMQKLEAFKPKRISVRAS